MSITKEIKQIDTLAWAGDLSEILVRAASLQGHAELLSCLIDYLRDECNYSIVNPEPTRFEGDVFYTPLGKPESLIGSFLGINPKELSLAKTDLYDSFKRCQAVVNGERCEGWSGEEKNACYVHDDFASGACRMAILREGRRTLAACENDSCNWAGTFKDNREALKASHQVHLGNFKARTSDKNFPVSQHAGHRLDKHAAPAARIENLNHAERQEIVASFFSWLSVSHNALCLDRRTEAACPISDLAAELTESFFEDAFLPLPIGTCANCTHN